MKNITYNYIKFLASFANIQKQLKIILDCSNGASSIPLKILQQHPIQNLSIDLINNKIDGNFPAHGPNPLNNNKAINFISHKILKYKYDLGGILDGDGDRIILIDNIGNPIPAYIIANLFMKKYKGPFVFDTLTYESLKYANLLPKNNFFVSQTGHRLMQNTMHKYKAEFGIEYSGHLYFKTIQYHDDPLFGLIQISNIISSLPYTINDYIKLLEKHINIIQINIKINDSTNNFINRLENTLFTKTKKIISTDGSIFEFKNGWIQIRQSHTEPLFRIFIGIIQ
ncbi:MAG: hypothetical protein ACP5IC_02670 [Minisyncoccia bacterium]